ncbi:hypothetical protein JHL18_14890 [Clostridium sp. YIM B02505]|uniref:Uncharacterized protein n=1 Tax=Clostridium yunnanense TaxID=2800325 RepID=A0ABS1ER82_9CLOT|nr:hypothetical protein [Clostridium yunnanense]MBK1811906.1 hypothetical protein [Clostridium yunnanense]
MAEYPHTSETFKAFVDAFIPRTPPLALKLGEIQFWGGLDLKTDQYLIKSLNNYLSLTDDTGTHIIPLAEPTAIMLNKAAKQLILIGGNTEPINLNQIPITGVFAALSPVDRFLAITLLEELKVDLSSLPYPYTNNPGFILSVTSTLNRLTIVGYYSEWSGYGTTALKAPDNRKLEYYPLSWEQIKYPGPSKGYHVMRGYLVKKFTD